MIVFRSAIYRVASVQAFVRMVVNHLWSWIYRSGVSREQILGWFERFLHCDVPTTAELLPQELVDTIARLMAGSEWNCGDFIMALEEALERPPAGFRWRTDRYGKHYLTKVESETQESAIIKGKRFANKIFVGVWWTTETPKAQANQKFQRFIRTNNGAVFWNEKSERGRQYGAFLIVDRDVGESVANTLCELATRVDLEGQGEHRLSAISMDGVAEHREVRNSDQMWVGCIRSIKFNWLHSLPDLLNGRIDDFRNSREYQDLTRLLRER